MPICTHPRGPDVLTQLQTTMPANTSSPRADDEESVIVTEVAVELPPSPPSTPVAKATPLKRLAERWVDIKALELGEVALLYRTKPQVEHLRRAYALAA